MKRICVFMWIVFCFSACSDQPEGLTKTQLEAKADSLFRIELPALQRQAREDLKNRLPIELKPKIDSIRNNNYEIPPVPQLDAPGLDSVALLPPLPGNGVAPSLRSGLKKAPPARALPPVDVSGEPADSSS